MDTGGPVGMSAVRHALLAAPEFVLKEPERMAKHVPSNVEGAVKKRAKAKAKTKTAKKAVKKLSLIHI